MNGTIAFNIMAADPSLRGTLNNLGVVDNMLKYLAGPFITLLNPAACYAIITSGLLNSWYVGSAIILAGVFSGPPWNFGPAEIGYLGAGPFVGGMIGSIFVGWASDPIIKYMGKRNKGV